ncbi:MAG: hypothetical protein OEW58_12415 [Gammaproteobacteria bacterium]|nr:hypothetical protein [Gammaproteobacteria bacterium]
MLNLFKKTPLLPEEAALWLHQGFGWCLTNFGSDAFAGSALIQPNDQHFPGRENSVHGMASLILGHVQRHAGLSHWPVRAVDIHQMPEGTLSATTELATQSSTWLDIGYEPQQVSAPEVLIANYAHVLAHHLGLQAKTPPPCEADQWPLMTELLAIYLGFGIMLANTASPYRGGGCGSCRCAATERQGFLSQDEATYALAMFCSLKQVNEKEVTTYLKSSLRPFFKKAMKELSQTNSNLHELAQISSQPALRFITVNPAPN